MEAKAYLKYARISPRKVQIVLDLIRGKDVATAMGILQNKPRAASELLIKLLKSAIANAENNFQMDASKLYSPSGPDGRWRSPRRRGLSSSGRPARR